MRNPDPAAIPEGLVGALLGAAGILPMLSAARDLALRVASPPRLPGREMAVGDIKAASFAEAAVLLVAAPLAAFFFGKLLPRLLESRCQSGRLSFEWIAAGFAASLPLWRGGARVRTAMAAGTLLALLVGFACLQFRRRFGFRRLFVRSARADLAWVFATGAAWDLARRASPRQFPALLGDPLSEVSLVGLALLGLVLGAGGRRAPVLARRIARRAGAPLLLSAAAIVAWRHGPALLATAGAFVVASGLAPVRPARPGAPGRKARSLGLLAFLLACAATIYYRPVGEVDLFEDGHSLGLAEMYLRGGAPYVDTYPLHGWGVDGGVDAVAFRIAGPSLRTFRARRAATAVLGLATLGAASWAMLGSCAGGALAFLLSLGFCPFFADRHTLAFASLALLALGARRLNPRLWAAAGVLAGWEVLFSLDLGLFVLAGGLLGVLTLPFLTTGARRCRVGLRGGLVFLGGALAGAAPFLLDLARKGSLGPFARASFREIPGFIGDVWGLPAGSAAESLRSAHSLPACLGILTGGTGGPAWLFVILLLTAAVAVFLWRRSSGEVEAVDRAAWIGFAVAACALRGALARYEEAHLAFYAVFTGPVAAWLLLRAWRSGRHRLAYLFLVGGVLFLRLQPVRTAAMEAYSVAYSGLERADRSTRAVAWRPGDSGKLPAGQAETIHSLKRFVDGRLKPDETFFDFSNEPALYFLLDRSVPTRYFSVPLYESPERQREVIADLETRKPPLAILSSGTFADAFDGIPNAQRAPAVAAYLRRHYRPVETVAGRAFAERVDSEGTDRPALASLHAPPVSGWAGR